MGQYRIEISPNNRAVCKDTVCKANKDKILKSTLRFGSWVEIHEHGSWAWKHWGCVSGAQLVSIRDACDKGDGSLDFDAIDGYDELNDHGDIQAKIRRCVQQGHIDPDDFNGDPEKNKAGEKGIRLPASRKAAIEAEAAAANGDTEDEAPPKKAAKRGRKKADDEDVEDEPATKKPKTKTSKAAAKPTKATKPTKADKATPAKAARGKAARKAASDDDDDAADDGDGLSEEETPAKKPARKAASRAKEASKAAPAHDTKAPAKRSRRASKAAVKVDDGDEEPMQPKPEVAPKAKGRGKVKEEAAEPVKPRRGRPRKA